MADLVAQAENGSGRWRRPLPLNTTLVLGRQHCQWSVPWDSQISRRHAELLWDGKQLQVTRLPVAVNPVFFHGKGLDSFAIQPGEHFVIGQTSFTLTGASVGATLQMPDPTREQLFSRQRLSEIRFRDAERRLAIVTELPALIADAATDQELFIRVLNVLFGGIALAASAAVVSVSFPGVSRTAAGPDDGNSWGRGKVGSGNPGAAENDEPVRRNLELNVLHWDRRRDQSADFQPSQRLIMSAAEKQQTVLHVWDSPQSHAAMTELDSSHDWAFATPLAPVGNQTLVLYVSGALQAHQHSDATDSIANSLQEDIKYAELVASILGSLMSLRHMQTRQASLRSFFSPVVLDALQDKTPEELFRPQQCEVSVLFCDLRGFSAASERMAHDLMQLLQRVSEALGVTTSQILKQRGVVGDFHGDATMGFWGWPLAQPDRAQRACQAATDIHRQFQELSADTDSPLHGFQLGLGIASGTAVAGQIGTQDQVKVTAFGPVVNLAARLETMNRQLGTAILIEQRTAEMLRKEWAEQETVTPPFRIRGLGKVLPVGFHQAIEISEVVPPFPLSPLTDDDLQAFADAQINFQNGNWEQAYRQLHQVPATDRAKDLLNMLITQHNRQAPPHWDGIIRLTQK